MAARTSAATKARNELGLRCFARMLLIRGVEDEVQRMFTQGLVRGTTHLYQGQEASAVGVCFALREGDTMTCTYRGHGAVLAMGAPADAVLGEIMGKAKGLCGGKGGSMHLTDVGVGAYGSFAIVGAHLPIAVGLSFASRYLGDDAVSVCFFGDGTTNIGAFHEALNLASLWKTPTIFVCENNRYGEYSPQSLTTPVERLADRAASYDMPGVVVDGNDVFAVYATAGEAVERARKGLGPTLIESLTYRQVGHSRSDPAKYRPEGELDEWLARDPIVLLERALVEGGVARGRARGAARERRAGRRGRAGARQVVARPDARVAVREHPGMTEVTYRQAITQALADELEADERVILFGEDVAAAGGVFKATEGLQERFGPERVLDTPISEQAIVGCAIGAAIRGLNPVIEIMFADFAGVCFDQLANELPKYRYMTDGQVSVGLTVRLANGAGGGFGAQHSQSVENWFLSIIGLKIVTPATPADAYALLRAAIRDPNPVLFFEHKNLYNTTGELEADVPATIGKAAVVARGQRHHARREPADALPRARGRRAAGGRGRLGRGDRPAHDDPVRPRDGRREPQQDQPPDLRAGVPAGG